MWTCFLFSIGLSVALASELELFRNDWVPVSTDIVYNQIRRGITQAPRFTKTNDVNVLKPDVFRFVSKHQEYEDGSKNYNLENDTDELNNEDSTTYIDDTYDNEPRLQKSVNHNRKIEATIRKSKKLANIDSQVILNRKLLPEIDKPNNTNLLKRNNNLKFKEKVIKDNTYTYEVTENSNIDDEKQEESAVNENGYVYNRPAKYNFSTELTKHLSKYNINENDNLQNYALSRRHKAKTPVRQDHLYKSLRFRAPKRYNSLNHLPVDPLLSVFLSNYGHYLQGQYGISNNYNNLYGYLASNNIHNNRPFGLYKIFSDTDSSNK